MPRAAKFMSRILHKKYFSLFAHHSRVTAREKPQRHTYIGTEEAAKWQCPINLQCNLQRSTAMTFKSFILALAVLAGLANVMTATVASANAPGGAYIQCDGSRDSPVRCKPDGW